MSSDAIAVFNPKDLDKLKPFLDLDDESEESEGLYAEQLEDGATVGVLGYVADGRACRCAMTSA